VGLKVKHRQLVRLVGVIIDDPQKNSMATFNFTSTVLNEGTTFIFGLWVCVVDGTGNFCWHLIDDMKPKASAASQRSGLNEFIDKLDKTLSDPRPRDCVHNVV
jgi:hypothetical protein